MVASSMAGKLGDKEYSAEFDRRGDELEIVLRIPADFAEFALELRDDKMAITLDGAMLEGSMPITIRE